MRNKKKAILSTLIWILVACAVGAFYRLRGVSPVNDFVSWAIGVWPILAALGAAGVAATTWVIKQSPDQEQHRLRVVELFLSLRDKTDKSRIGIRDAIAKENTFIEDDMFRQVVIDTLVNEQTCNDLGESNSEIIDFFLEDASQLKNKRGNKE